MHETLLRALMITGAYLIGAIPFGLILARRFAGVDVRESGSGNIGATNVARSAGKTLGILTLSLDAAKGALPVLVAERVLDQPVAVSAAAGLASVVGHVFPVYLKLKGGKGVATGFGVFVALTPVATLIAAGVFLVTYLIARVVSLGSLLGALTLILATVWLDGRVEVLVASVLVVLLIFARHRSNIARLLKRSEHHV